MGLFDFGSSKPHVSRDEFKKKVRGALYGKGFTEKELDQLEGFFGGDMQEPQTSQAGIDVSEIQRGVDWLRQHPHDHTFSPNQVNEIEAELKKHL